MKQKIYIKKLFLLNSLLINNYNGMENNLPKIGDLFEEVSNNFTTKIITNLEKNINEDIKELINYLIEILNKNNDNINKKKLKIFFLNKVSSSDLLEYKDRDIILIIKKELNIYNKYFELYNELRLYDENVSKNNLLEQKESLNLNNINKLDYLLKNVFFLVEKAFYSLELKNSSDLNNIEKIEALTIESLQKINELKIKFLQETHFFSTNNKKDFEEITNHINSNINDCIKKYIELI